MLIYSNKCYLRHNRGMEKPQKTDRELTDAIESVVREAIEGMEFDAEKRLGRPTVLPTLVLWAGMLVCVARGFSSQLDVWRLLTRDGFWDHERVSMSDEGIYKRLKRAASDSMERIYKAVTQLILQRRAGQASDEKKLAPFAAGVYALDEMTLDAVSKRLPRLRQIAGTVLPGKVAALFDLRSQMWHHVQFRSEVKQNEKVAARDMIEVLPVGSLILADMGYFAFAWFDDLTKLGHYWVSRMRAKTSYTIKHTLYKRDGVLDAIVWLGAYRADRAGHAVRLVSFSRNGKTWAYITNVLDPSQLSIIQIAQLYARRWDIEMMFNMIKTHLNLHMLWSSHAHVVAHQLFAVFTIAQIILGIRSDIAQQAKADPFEISLDLLIRWLPRIARDGHDPVQFMVENGRAMLIIRPSTRTIIEAPNPPLSDYTPLLSDESLIRHERYAGKA